MKTEYIPTLTGVARVCGTTRSTIYKWQARGDGFPAKTAQGWDKTAAMEYAAKALDAAAKHQQGTDADLKREKLQLQVKILETELQRKRGELAVETDGTIPRPVAIEQLQMICFAVWSSMNAKITTLGNTVLAGNCAAYTCLCNSGTEFLQAAKREVARRLKDSPLKLTTEEIEDCTRYQGGNRW